MNANLTGRKGTAMVLAAILGGIAGYLITDLLVYKMLESEYFDDLDEVNPPVEIGDESEPKAVRVDYASAAKVELTDLIKDKDYAPKDKPHVISAEEAHECPRQGYYMEEIKYYALDTTFANEDEEIIEDPVAMFGPNIQLQFGEKSEDPDIVYVLANSLGVVYEIVQLHESYAVQVMGEIPPAPKNKGGRPKGSKNKPKDEDDDINTKSTRD